MAQWSEAQMATHKDTAKIVWDFCKAKGLSNEVCGAILGNIERESHFDSGAIESNGEGHGLIQWSYRRKTNLLKYASDRKKSWKDINLQLNFMWDELKGSEKSAFKLLKNTTDVVSATKIFNKSYERSGDKERSIGEQERITSAKYWYNQFKDTSITTNSSSNSSSQNKMAEDGANSEYFYKYFNAGYLEIPDELSIAMMDELVKVDPLRRIEPLQRLDYIEYGHRYYNTIYNLTLGDCCFVIPPQAISIMSESNSQELVTLRQENTQKIKSGYSKRTVSIELVFHGHNQINGYKVESPEGYYYVDGLRQLLAQFKCTPFLPIENYTINNTYNIHAVALQSIVCSTVEGFPDMMIANLTLQEVDLYPYIETHTMFFSDFIDWDLFRFYYQRQLTEKHEYGKLQSIPVNKTLNKFKISILNESVFNNNIDYDTDNELWYGKKWNIKGKKTSFSFYDIVLDRKIVYTDDNGKYHVEDPSNEHPSNFETYIDSDVDNIYISTFQCGYSNILTNIQMAEQAHPTVQYMGGMDTMFNITFETTNEDIVTALEKCNIMNNMITRNNKDCTSLGFVKLESELVELFGSKFVMIDSVTTHTVPDFPGLFICQINCVSYDIYQKENEGIHGLSPFEGNETDINGTGTKDNAISQSPSGLKEKVKQDTCVENKLRTITELYPDLKLPTYKEVDEVISKIITFRESHTNRDGNQLSAYPINKYPRTPQRMLHGISKISNIDIDNYGFVKNVPEVIDNSEWYEGFVDPDFYVFYPETYKKMMNETEEDRVEAGDNYTNPVPKAKTTTITRTKFGSDEITDSDISNYDYDLYSQGATELQMKFIALARKKIGATYSNARRLGPNSYDCSGLVSKCLMEMGIINNSFTTSGVKDLIKSGTLKQKWKVSDRNNIKELLAHASPGDLLHVYNTERGTSMGHIAIYAGNNKMIHASSTKNRVCEVDVYNGTFARVLAVPALYKGAKSTQDIKQKTTSNIKVKVNMNLKKGDTGSDVRQLQTLLNQLNDAGLEVDGKFGPLTEQAVKDFQSKYNLEANGIVGKKTSAKLTKVANKKISESSSKTTTKSGADANYIKQSELEAIAKTIANIQLGKPYTSQVALAQLIYDRLTTNKAKYGNLNNILNSKIFKGQYSKKLPESSTAYKAAKNVFCNGERAFNKQLINYLGLDSGNSSYLTLDKQYDRAGTLGDFTFWTNGKKTSNKKFTLVDEDTDNKTVSDTTTQETTEINTGVTELDASFAKYFGKPVLVKTSEMEKDGGWIKGLLNGTGLQNQETRYQNNYNTDVQTLMTSFVNQCEYSGKGRLVKAFPSYLFCIVDDDGNWLDGRKLWANYYALRSLVEIQVVNYDDSPVNTATVTVTNSYGNLDTLPPNAFYYRPANDSEYNKFQKFMYQNFGMLPGFGPKLTQTLVDQKNIIYNSMIIRAGCRMHLRMGYGSDPLSLPVVMNGYISDLQVGDITQFVCVSDGVELTNSIISDNPKDVNGIFESQESSNICIDILTARQSWLNKINVKWGEPNKYGIEHFGLYFSEHLDVSEAFEGLINKIPGVSVDIPDSIGDWSYEPVLDDEDSPLENVADGAVNVLKFAGNTVETVFDTLGTGVKLIGDGIFKGWKTVQYDLIKNIYRGSYDGSLAMYTPFWGFFDGEKNLCFSQYNKTPWDAIQMAVMNIPEYIGMPLYHQFDSRLFLGLPWFLAKYRYDLINGEMYEEAKTFAQCHFIDSLSEIIDNQMVTTSRDVYTNAIVMYTLGKSPKATPTLYSDKSINFSQQSTKIFDSSVSQNLVGPDQLWEWLGWFGAMGKEGACRVGITQLLWNWEKAYQGDILILGDAGIQPDDYIYLNDRFNDLTGLCTARTVIHSLSSKTGFTTTITPGMIGMNTMQESQAQVVLTNIMTVGGAFSYYMSIKKTIKDNADKVSDWYNTCKWTTYALTTIDYGLKGILVTVGIKKMKNAYKILKTIDYAQALKDLKNIGSVIKKSYNAYKAVETASKVTKIGEAVKVLKAGNLSFKLMLTSGGTVAAPGLGTVVGYIVGCLLDILLNVVIDYFRWNNVLVLLPMMHKSSPYAPILSGDKLLLTGSSNTSKETMSSIEDTSKEEGDPGKEINMSDQTWMDKEN